MDVLPLIAMWLNENGYPRDSEGLRYLAGLDLRPSRAVLLQWLELKGVSSVELAADALIAAGIGRSEEQESAVWCSVEYRV